jgi:hypothetical protein
MLILRFIQRIYNFNLKMGFKIKLFVILPVPFFGDRPYFSGLQQFLRCFIV